MSKLRTKQILDFALDVTSAMSSINATQNAAISANETAIANLDDTYATDTQLSDAVAVEKLRAEGAEGVNAGLISDNKVAISSNATAIAGLDSIYATDDELSDAVAVEKLRAETQEGKLSVEIVAEKNRLDAILLDSTEALDTFAEIKSFVDGLVSDDVTIVGRVSDNEADISDNKVAISSNASAIAGLDDTYATDTQLSDAVAVEKLRAEGVEGSLSAEIIAGDAATLSDAKVYADGLVGGVDYREEEGKLLTATTFSTVNTFDQTIDAEVDVFINGLQIHRFEEGVEGMDHGWKFTAANAFEIVNLGYTLDEKDHMIVSGKLA